MKHLGKAVGILPWLFAVTAAAALSLAGFAIHASLGWMGVAVGSAGLMYLTAREIG